MHKKKFVRVCGIIKIRDSIIVFQNVNYDSTTIFINKKDNGWLKDDVKLKTVNYWINAPIELSSRFQNNTLILTRSFIGNNIVGDHILFKRKKYKYYFSKLIEFEQK